MTKTVLITGASGFLGGYVASRYNRNGWDVIGLDKFQGQYNNHPAKPRFQDFCISDLDDIKSISTILGHINPAVCIHLAGPASVKASIEDPSKDFISQTLPLFNLIEGLRRAARQIRLLLISSAAVYGNPVSLPISEDHRILPISPYGYHKYHQELILNEYHSLYGLPVCKARVFSTYGPGMKQLAVWDITRRALGGDFTVFGAGEETRDYLFAGDVAEAVFCICENAGFTSDVYNVASGNEISIVDLAKKIYALLEINREPVVTKQCQTGNPIRWRADIRILKNLGFSHQVSLDEGLKTTIKWIKNTCLR